MASVYVSTYDIDMTQCRAVEWFDHQSHFVHLSESCLVCFSRASAQPISVIVQEWLRIIKSQGILEQSPIIQTFKSVVPMLVALVYSPA